MNSTYIFENRNYPDRKETYIECANTLKTLNMAYNEILSFISENPINIEYITCDISSGINYNINEVETKTEDSKNIRNLLSIFTTINESLNFTKFKIVVFRDYIKLSFWDIENNHIKLEVHFIVNENGYLLFTKHTSQNINYATPFGNELINYLYEIYGGDMIKDAESHVIDIIVNKLEHILSISSLLFENDFSLKEQQIENFLRNKFCHILSNDLNNILSINFQNDNKLNILISINSGTPKPILLIEKKNKKCIIKKC